MKTRTNKLSNLLKIGVLLFGISLSLWNCENENIIDSQEVTIQNKFQKLFNKQDFKQTIPFSYKVNWENSVKKYSEELKTNFYEFELTYNTPFNPTTINKSKKEGYNTAYKLIATESNENKIEFFIAKFFQKKDGIVEIEALDISLNNNSGYKGLTHLYDNSNELYFAKKINIKENKEAKRYFKNEELKIKNLNLAAKDVTVCNTTTLYHYIDWYRYTYDAYGNLISVVYLYTEYVGSSNTTTCTTEFQPDEPIRIIRNSGYVPCNDGTGRTNCVKYIEPQIFCEVGFEPDENGNCKEVTKLPTEDLDLPFSFSNALNLTNPQKEWINDLRNKQAKDAITNYLNSFSLIFNPTTPEYENAKSFAYQAIVALFTNSSMTINDIDFDDRIINKLPEKGKCVFNKLKNLNLFKTTIKKFENSKSYNLILERGNTCTNSSDEACTDASDLANGNITTTFQSLGSNNLSFAASLLHEGIHADIYKYVDEHKKGIDPNDRPNVLYYYNLFKAENALDKGTTFAQHEHMQDKYVIPIAEAIRKLDGNRYPLKDYIGFGWDGLKVYKYDKYIDANGNIKTISPTDRTKLIDKANLIAASSTFATDCK